jgi:acid phosphatase type 7
MKAGWALATLLLLLVPTASAQDYAQQVEQVHLAWDRQEYWVAFLHPLILDPARTKLDITYTTEDGATHKAEWFRGANTAAGMQVYHFRMDPNTTAYKVGAKTYDIEPAPGPGEPVRVAFLADFGQTANSKAILAQIAASNVSMILMGGDLSYADGDASKWDSWFRMIEPVASRIPVQPARGNHEGRCLPQAGVNGLDCTSDEQAYRFRFFPEEDLLTYGYEWGAGRFYSLDSEAYYPRKATKPSEIVYNTDPDEQRAFLRDRLIANEKAWELVYFHRPMFSSSGAHGSELEIREHLASTLEEGGADLVLAGHDHDYERMWPLRQERVVARTNESTKGDAPVYVVSGGGGESLYKEWAPLPDWTAHRAAEYHFLLIDINAERLDVQAIRADGSVLDHFSILRGPDPNAPATPHAGRSASAAFSMVVLAITMVTLLRRR